MNKTIYKKDNKNKIRFINFEVTGPMLIQSSGVIDTLCPIVQVKTCVGKNIGRSNETTPEQQALLEFNSRLKRKLDKEYFLTEEEAKTVTVILPMLAKKLEDEYSKIEWTNKDQHKYLQPKLDGMRCLVINDELISRDNKNIMVTGGGSMQHIVDELVELRKLISEEIAIDGELYCHGISFQENMKLIKKKRPNSTEIKFYVYDVISETNYMNRYDFIKRIISNDFKYITVCPTIRINSEEELNKYHDLFITRGFEGSILRVGSKGYEMKRSSSLLKKKDFIDAAATITDIVPCEQRPTWGKPVCRVDVKDGDLEIGVTFDCNTKLSHADREYMLAHPEEFIGKTAEIRYFELTDKGKPRHPTYYGLRLDK